MKYDLVITDYDGTLGHGNDVDASTIKAIKEYSERGGKFIVCTGRLYNSISKIMNNYGIKGDMVCSQGAIIKNSLTGETLLDSGFDTDACKEVVRVLEKDGINTVLCTEDTLYYKEISDYVTYYLEYGVNAEHVDDLYTFIDSKVKKIQKVIGYTTAEKVPFLLDKYSKLNIKGVLVNSGGRKIVEFVNPDFCKGQAVRFLSKYFDIPFERIMTVGDSSNDITLVEGPWHGVAVGNSVDSLKKVAKEIAPSFEDNPVLFLLNKYCL